MIFSLWIPSNLSPSSIPSHPSEYCSPAVQSMDMTQIDPQYEWVTHYFSSFPVHQVWFCTYFIFPIYLLSFDCKFIPFYLITAIFCSCCSLSWTTPFNSYRLHSIPLYFTSSPHLNTFLGKHCIFYHTLQLIHIFTWLSFLIDDKWCSLWYSVFCFSLLIW